VIADAELADYAEWAGWLPPAVDQLALLGEDEPLQQALAALRRPAAPRRTPCVLAQVERIAAHLAARRGAPEEAVAHSRSAERLARECELAFDAAVIALERVELVPDVDTAMTDAATAAETFRAVGADPWQARALAALQAPAAPAASAPAVP
jgi:hypothetical protein